MPTSIRETLLVRYHYDPLDRLVDSTPFEQSAIRRYYCKTRLATETQGSVQRSIVQHDDQLLAQQQHENGKAFATLLATDQQRSVMNALDATQPHPLAYTSYGHRPAENGLLSLLGFNGERPDPVTGHYHLGNGYRQFNPVLMRFNSPDSWSPFGEGGLNAYAYCGGEPVLRSDPDGHKFGFLKAIGRKLRLRSSAKIKTAKTFNADPNHKLASSKLFKNVDLGNYSDQTTKATAVYQQKNNALFIDREVTGNYFSFSTRTQINSQGQPRKPETLISITPDKNLSRSDPDTFKYVNRLQRNISAPLTENNIMKIRHPETQRQAAVATFHKNEMDSRINATRKNGRHGWYETSDDDRFDYRSKPF